MITLIIVKNPFEPWNGRETKKIVAGSTVQELLQTYALPGVETLAVVNGHEAEGDYVTKPEDFVVLCPVVGKSGGGKQILALVLSVALSFASMGAGAAFATEAGKWTLNSYLAAAGVMIVGNMLIGRLTAQKADMGSYGENNPTYSWGDIQTMVGQNNPIALTYGTVMSGGQSIGKYVDTLDNDEYLNWLIAAGEGPLEISDITMNDNDIDNFGDVKYEVRSGTNTQEPISNFNDTYFVKALEYQLTDGARVDEAQGNATEGLVVKLEFPSGLFCVNDKGDYKTAWVKVKGDYRLGEDGEWIPFVKAKATACEYIESINVDAVNGTYTLRVVDTSEYDESSESSSVTTTATVTYPDSTVLSRVIHRGQSFKLGYFTILIPDDEETPSTINETFVVSDEGAKISSNKSSAVRKEFRIDNLTPGKYYVRMEVTERSHALTNTKASVRCFWTGLTSIVYDDFCYPNIALIGIRAKATDQLNGSPSLKFKKHNPGIWVWDPYAEEYVQKASDNPAWACYDALHLCRELEEVNNRGHFIYDVGGVPAGRMLYDRFSEWADFCDEQNLKVNIEINQIGEMLDVINQKIAPIGHGKVIRLGTKYGCTWDCKKQPVQMFGMGNIKAGTFQEQFLPTNDRANAVELTYMDAENNYNRETITILADDYDTAADVKMAQATFDGITSYEQAYREGKYQLYCNKYRLRTVSFNADIDSISCTIGDAVLIAHDVPKWAHSGRIHEVKGDELLLPVELEDGAKSYRLMYRTVNDNLYTANCEVLENKDGWCRVRIESLNTEDPPQRHDIFDLAERNVGSKPFVIQNISRAKDFDRKIECVEYDERIYSEDFDIPPISYHEDDMRPKNVTNVSARSYHYINTDGVTRQHLDVTWQRASTGTFTVSVYNADSGWNVVASGVTQNTISLDLDVDATQIRIVTVQGVSATTGTVTDIENVDTLRLVLAIENLTATAIGSTVRASWDEVTSANFDYYLISFRSVNYTTKNPNVEFGGVPNGTYTFSVSAVSKQGTIGDATTTTVTVGGS